MDNQLPALFLQSLHADKQVTGSSDVPAERVNGMGTILGLSHSDTFDLIEALHNQGLVDVRDGGVVSLTRNGCDMAEGKTKSDSPVSVQIGNLHQNAQVSFNVNSPGAVAGANAMGQGAVVGELVAALQRLREVQPTLDDATQAELNALQKELSATIEETQKEQPDNDRLEQTVDKATNLIKNINAMSKSAETLIKTLKVAGTALGALAARLFGT